MISDIIIIVIVVLFLLLGIRRGLAKSILNLAGIIVSAFIANMAANWLSSWIYTTFIQQGVVTNISDMIQSNSSKYAIENCFDALPDWLNSAISGVANFLGTSTTEIAGTFSVSQSTSTSIAQAIEKPVGEFVVALFAVALVAVLFIIIFVLVKFLIRFIAKFFEFPVIRQINKFLGGILGFAEGVVFVFLAINIFYVIMSYINPTFLNNSLVSGNLFKFLCSL